MNREQIKRKTETSIKSQLYKRGYATCVDCLVDLGWLKPSDVMQWRRERLSSLEYACNVKPAHYNIFLKYYHQFAKEHNYKLSWTCYRRKKTKHRLRFTKNNDENAEQRFAMHIVCMECKKNHKKPNDVSECLEEIKE